jgi:hypothetical protein
VAAINAKETMGASMLLGFPDWIVFTSMCIPFGISALIAALHKTVAGETQDALKTCASKGWGVQVEHTVHS